MVVRALITTADEQTWPKSEDEPVLFLGEWCKRYSRKEKWEKLNATVAPYHWDDRKLLYSDYQYLQELYEKLLVELSHKLNQIHGTDHSHRYWRILIGPWLGYFTQELFDRWTSIQNAIHNYELSGTVILAGQEELFVPNDMAHYLKLVVKPEWNHYIYSYILKQHTSVRCTEKIREPIKKQLQESSDRYWYKKFINIKGTVFTFLDKITRLLTRDNDAFFINTYLPRFDEIKLHLRMAQIPRFLRETPTIKTAFDSNMRKWKLYEENSSEFEACARTLIPQQIPTIYLEGFTKLAEQVAVLSWPSSPKVIFTSSSYSTDDIFKYYAAEKTEQGSPLVSGQHGGGIGTHLFAFYEDHQIAICDTYLSWGWTEDSMPKVKSIGQLKSKQPLGVQHSKQDGILLVTWNSTLNSHQIYSGPLAGQVLDYLDDQFEFVGALIPTIRNVLKVRLKADTYGWEPIKRWKNRFPDILIDEGYTKINKLIKKSRIYVSTYNATTYLESFTTNVPTVIYWNSNHWELRNSAIPYFNKLREVGIFHDTPESAAQHVNEIWEDVNLWWESDAVQEALKSFKTRYCFLPANLLDRVEGALKDEIKTSKQVGS